MPCRAARRCREGGEAESPAKAGPAPGPGGRSLNKKVAAVIPLYNHERYIAEAIRSLLDQTVPLESIVIVDDGSTDGSVEAASAFKDPRIRLFRQANAGAHAALNRGIAEAGCEYVALLNSDDAFHPRRVERCLAFLEENPELDLAFTRLKLIDSGSSQLDPASPRAKWFEAVWSLEPAELPLPEWLGIANFAGTTSNFFARRSWLLEHPFRDYRYAHDYHALILCALSGRLGLVPEELLSYRVHPQNTITTAPEPLIREMLRLNLDLLRELGPRLRTDPGLPAAFAQYARASWENVSSFPAGVFQTVLAGIVADADPDALTAALQSLQTWPELTRFPNRSSLPGSGGKYDALKDEHALMKQHAKLLRAVALSRWLALGGFLGVARKLARDEGRTVAEKHRALVERLLRSRWLALGGRLRLRSAMAVIDLCRQPK